MNSKLFFLHNPKAGGTSLRKLFSELNHEKRVAPNFSNAAAQHKIDKPNLKLFSGYDLYFGHFGYDALRLLSRDYLVITNFRHPVSRIYSLYRYWRNDVTVEHLNDLLPEDASVVFLAKNLSFSQFIRIKDKYLKLYISNFHFRQIYRSGWVWSRIDETTVELVKERIIKMAWFYVAESPAASMRLAVRIFPELAGRKLPIENISSGMAEIITPEDAQEIIVRNMYDCVIYDFAVSLQNTRLGLE